MSRAGVAVHHEDASTFDSAAYAAALLRELGVERGPSCRPALHPALRWANCGAMSLTGRRDGPAMMCPVPLASCADGALSALQVIADVPDGELPAGGELLGERAALAGLMRNGRVAPGGACRLLDCADGRIAVSLARPEDWASLPAWLATEVEPAWEPVAAAVAGKTIDALLERGRLLSLAIAAERLHDELVDPWFEVDCEHAHATRRARAHPLVVDLSSLWAGPLCTHLLELLGARVVKVESAARPDGARAGNATFFDLLNRGKASVAVDLGSPEGRDLLRRLLAEADIVVEASRPRALAQLGIDAAEYCAAGRAVTWISLTGHGRGAPQDRWIAFGDDAAVAAGLATVMHRAAGDPLFCGDAIADPLAGMHAALAAWWSHRRGGARRISLSLTAAVRNCLRFAGPLDAQTLRERQVRWTAELGRAQRDARAPVARERRGAARPLGSDTAAVAGQYRRFRISSGHTQLESR